jgi:hypothetical protein
MSMLHRFWLRFWYRTITSPYVIVAIGGAIALIMVVTCIFVLLQTRQDEVDRAREALSNLGSIAERDIERNFELYALSLQSTVTGLNYPGVMQLPWQLRHAVLFDNTLTASYLGAILVLDANGNVILDSCCEVPRKANFSDRAYFTAQRDNPDLGLYISTPYKSKFRGTPTIALSRRVSRPDGSFAGVVVLAVGLDYFHQLFASLELGPHGLVALLGRDGTMYIRHPHDVKIVGQDFGKASAFRHFLTEPEGTFFDTSTIDGTKRLYYFKNFPKLPFIITVAKAQTDIIYAA